jgi:hypothetical protein
MSIQERINPDNLNIHHFQETPEGRPELPFDVDRDIDPVYRQALFLKCITNKDQEMPLAYRLKLLWPKESFNYSLEELRRRSKQVTDNWGFLSIASEIKTLRPDYVFDNSELEKIKAGIERAMNSSVNSSSLFTKLEVVVNAKLIGYDPSVTLSPKELEQLKRNSDRQLSQLNDQPILHGPVNLRLLDPTYKPVLTSQEWEFYKDQLNKLKEQDSSWNYSTFASHMKILVAHKVEVTAPGVIEFQMHPPEINTSTPSIPETRKF